jgi:hypothetical protein
MPIDLIIERKCLNEMCWIQIETPKAGCFNPGWQVGSFAMGRAGTIAELDVGSSGSGQRKGTKACCCPVFLGKP